MLNCNYNYGQKRTHVENLNMEKSKDEIEFKNKSNILDDTYIVKNLIT